jgi:serine/threonine protein kinase, bacterial
VLPFTGLNDPIGVAVDGAGTVYVTDSNNNRVVKLTAKSTSQDVLPFNGLNRPAAVAVDGAGSVYVAEFANNRVLKLPAG